MPALDAAVCVLSSTVAAGVNRASHINSRLQFTTEAKNLKIIKNSTGNMPNIYYSILVRECRCYL